MYKTSTPQTREFLMGFTVLRYSLKLFFCLENECRGALNVRYIPNGQVIPWRRGEEKKDFPW